MGKLIALQPCANCGRPAPAHVREVCERCRIISQSYLDARVADLKHDGELLSALALGAERLAEIVPPHRRDELSHAFFYIRNELDLRTQETLLIVLTCLMVLHERYTAESA